MRPRNTSFGFLYFLATAFFLLAIFGFSRLLAYWANGWVATH